MKNLIAAITFFLLLSISAKAQDHHKSLVQLQGGLSWIGLSANIANTFNVVNDISFSSSPAFHLEYNHFIYERVSLGGGIAYQRISAFYENYQYESGGETINEDISAKLSRLNFSARALFWYNPNGSLRFYSGIRLGISNWRANTNTSDPNFDIDQYINIVLGASVAPQLILVGADFPLSEHFHFGGELSIGSPYFFSGGVGYSW